MKRLLLWVAAGSLLFLSALPSNTGIRPVRGQTVGSIPYAMDYTMDRRVDGALSLDFLNIRGLDDFCLEYVSEDKDSAQILSKMSLAPGSEADRSKFPRMSVILPILNNAGPLVVLRFRRGNDGPIVFYVKFTASSLPRRGRLYLGNGRDGAVVASAPACPPGCWLAQVVQLVPPVCVKQKCCQDGGVTYDLTNCTITCHNGDCD